MYIQQEDDGVVGDAALSATPCVFDSGRYASFIQTRTMGRVRGLCLKGFFPKKR